MTNAFKGTSLILNQLLNGIYGCSLEEIRPLLVAVLETNNRAANLVEAKRTDFFEADCLMVAQFDMLVLLQKIYLEFWPIAQYHSLNLHYETSPTYIHGTQVRADTVSMGRMLCNLLQNAIKYTNTGDIFLRLLNLGDNLVIEIEDTGIGIAAEQISSIFLPFWRSPNSSSVHLSGMGLGLYIALSVAHAHGLKMTVDSVVGHGTKFTIIFPYDGIYGLN